MRVWLASSGWNRPGSSMHTYAHRVQGALTAVGIEATPLPLARRYNARRGGELIPFVTKYLGRYPCPPESFVHDTDVAGTLRGVTVGTLHEMGAYHEPRRRSWTGRDAIRLTLRRSRKVIAVSEFLREEVRRIFGSRAAEKVSAIPVPFAPVPPGRLPVAYDVVWIGSPEPRKRIDLLLEALRSLPKVRAAVRWKPFPTRPDLNEPVRAALRRTPNATSLTDYLPDAEIDRLYRGSRCLVSTSEFEGFQAPVMEAYLRGCHVVLPDNELFPGRMMRGAPGVHFYPPGDPRSLGGAIEEALGDSPFVPSTAVVRAVSFPAVGEQLRACYQSVLPR